MGGSHENYRMAAPCDATSTELKLRHAGNRDDNFAISPVVCVQHQCLLAGTRTDGFPLILRRLGAIRETTVLLGTAPKPEWSQWMFLCCFKWALEQAVVGRPAGSAGRCCGVWRAAQSQRWRGGGLGLAAVPAPQTGGHGMGLVSRIWESGSLKKLPIR